jgi:hypothetical protein
MNSTFQTIALVLILSLLCIKGNLLLHSHQTPKDKIENIALSKVGALPEVKAYMQKYAGKHPALLLNDNPDPSFNYYTVKLGLNSDDMFHYECTFFVDPKTYQVYYWDALNDSDKGITLQQWRHWRNTPGFNKMHTYKHGKLVVLTNQ